MWSPTIHRNLVLLTQRKQLPQMPMATFYAFSGGSDVAFWAGSPVGIYEQPPPPPPPPATFMPPSIVWKPDYDE